MLLLSRFCRVRLCATPDSSPLGSSVPGILQARTLEWVAISFSNAWKWKVKRKSLSRARLLATPWTAAYQAPLSMGFSRQEYWSGGAIAFSAKIEVSHVIYATAAKSLQSCLTLFNPIDGLLPGSPVHGILQARTLEWVAFSFSNVIYMIVFIALLSVKLVFDSLHDSSK